MPEPFLKWAGGKRWLARRPNWMPERYRAYVEPFLGGGSVFFSLQPERGLLNDRNKELMNMYRVLRDHPELLRDHLQDHQKRHSEKHYYDVRSEVPSSRVERAARFLYLNRACWNGLYRVNRYGIFNVPKGTKDKVFFETDDYIGASKALRRVKLRSTDFEKIIDKAEPEDFVFVDPPYTVKHNLNGFARYNEKIFSWSDQERLARSVERAFRRGCFVAVTNADHKSVRDLYNFANYSPLTRSSVLAADSRKRMPITEALFSCNYLCGVVEWSSSQGVGGNGAVLGVQLGVTWMMTMN